MEEWISQRDTCRYIAVTDMHSLMQAQHAASFKKILDNADLVVPDGFPLVWLGRRKGFPLRRRVYGPELMERFCEETAPKGYRHFFYGGAPGVAEETFRPAGGSILRFDRLPGICCPPLSVFDASRRRRRGLADQRNSCRYSLGGAGSAKTRALDGRAPRSTQCALADRRWRCI